MEASAEESASTACATVQLKTNRNKKTKNESHAPFRRFGEGGSLRLLIKEQCEAMPVIPVTYSRELFIIINYAAQLLPLSHTE